MNKNILIGLLVGGAVVIIGGLATQNKSVSSCAEACQKASQTCPSLINEGTCNDKCSKLSETAKKHLSESSSCEEITSRPDLIADLLIPEINTPKTVDNNNISECEAACGSYVSKCLTLVPNATAALFNEGLSSCMSECANWNPNKIDCMINAFDCEAMTNVCGL